MPKEDDALDREARAKVLAGRFAAAVREGPAPRDFSRAPVHFRVKELEVFYSRKERRRKQAGLDDVSFTIRQGEVVYVMGKNGSGKSTLLNILAHRSKAKFVEGKVIIDGKEFEARAKKKKHQFSIGSIGIWDEDDHNNQGMLGQSFRDHSLSGRTSLVVSHHDMNNIFVHADHILYLHKGRLLLDDTPANIVRAMDANDASLPERFVDLLAPLIKKGQWDPELTRAILEKPAELAPRA